jgi:hypothetical protein
MKFFSKEEWRLLTREGEVEVLPLSSVGVQVSDFLIIAPEAD